MHYCRLASIVLMIGMTGLLGCYGTDSSTTETMTAGNVNKSNSMPGTEAATEPKFEFENPIFEAPVMLMAANEPMKASSMYASPVVFDIDNDGREEMVLGDIRGNVQYCKNEAETGEPVWGAVQSVETADGKPLELNNW